MSCAVDAASVTGSINGIPEAVVGAVTDGLSALAMIGALDTWPAEGTAAGNCPPKATLGEAAAVVIVNGEPGLGEAILATLVAGAPSTGAVCGPVVVTAGAAVLPPKANAPAAPPVAGAVSCADKPAPSTGAV